MNTSFFKKFIISAVVITSAVFAVSGAFAASGQATFNTDPDDYPLLEVSSYTANPGCTTCWGPSVSNVKPGDIISFEFFYHNTSNVTAHYTRTSITFSGSGSTVTATGKLWAQNASPINLSVTINAAPGYSINFPTGPHEYGIGEVAGGVQNFLVVRHTAQGSGIVPPITCSLSANPNSGNSPLTTALSVFAEGGSGGYTYNYVYGDGQESGYISEHNISHTYTSSVPKTFSPTVTVKDNQNNQKTCGTQVSVTTIPVQQPTANLWAEYNGQTVTQVPKGTVVTMKWNSTNATRCDVLAGAGFDTNGATSGSDPVSALAGTTTFSIRCIGPGGNIQANYTVYVTTIPQNPTVNLSANPTSVTSGNSTILSWTSNNATECYATQGPGFSTNGQLNGSDVSSALYNTATFSIVCTNSSGQASDSITVNVGSVANPTVNLSANPNSVTSGNSTTLSWNSNNATECHATQGPGFSTNGQLNGSDVSSALYSTATFSIVCTNNSGQASDSITVNVTNTPPQGDAPTVQTNSATGVTQTSATLNGSVDPNLYATTYWFEYGLSQTLSNSTGGQSAGSGDSSIQVSSAISGLSANTTYYFRVVAQNTHGTSHGSILSFTTTGVPPQTCQTAPYVTTQSATNITQTSAQVNGSVNPNGCSTYYWFEYGTNQNVSNTTNSQSFAVSPVNAFLSGLTSNTTYYFRLVARNDAGTTQGSILSFTTNTGGGSGDAPIVQTNSATGITQTSATLNGLVNPNGYSATYWFEYGTNQNVSNNTNSQSAGSGNNSINVYSSIGNLTSNTTYYFRVVAQNSYGTTYGSILSFVTQDGGGGDDCSAPYVQTRSANSVYESSAQLNGTINPNSCSSTYWFEYGTSHNLGNSTSYQSAGSGNGSFNVSSYISGLSQNRTYYFRIVGQNNGGTSYGQILNFSTNGNDDGDTPYVRTISATNNGNNSVVFYGSVNPNNGSDTYAWFEYGYSYGNLYNTTNSQFIGDGNYDQNYNQTSYSLNQGTVYYRAAARNNNGTAYGQILSINLGNNQEGNVPFVVTNPATSVGQNSAQLNGQVYPNNYYTTGWFEYGITASLGNRTIDQSIGSGASYLNISSAANSLLPNTTYYFRASARNSYGTGYGSILTFRTSGSGVIIPYYTPIPTQQIIVRTVTSGGTGLSCVVIVPSLNVSQLSPGERFTLTVTYRNGCNYNLSNVFLKVILPPGTEFVSTNYPFFNRDANGLSYNLGALPVDFQSAISIDGITSNSVQAGETLIFSAVLNFNDEKGRFQSVSAYLSAVVGSGKALGATVLEAFGNLLGNWIFDLLLVILVISLLYWIFFKRNNQRVEEDVLEARPLS